jgi:hypothetical protein
MTRESVADMGRHTLNWAERHQTQDSHRYWKCRGLGGPLDLIVLAPVGGASVRGCGSFAAASLAPEFRGNSTPHHHQQPTTFVACVVACFAASHSSVRREGSPSTLPVPFGHHHHPLDGGASHGEDALFLSCSDTQHPGLPRRAGAGCKPRRCILSHSAETFFGWPRLPMRALRTTLTPLTGQPPNPKPPPKHRPTSRCGLQVTRRTLLYQSCHPFRHSPVPSPLRRCSLADIPP